MAFVTTLHLQASADAALSCKPVQPVTRGGCESGQNVVESPTSMPSFCSNTCWATFHWVGNTRLFKAVLKTVSSIPGFIRCSVIHTLLGIPSSPGTFLALVQTQSTAASISAAVDSDGPFSASQGVITTAGSCGNNWSMILPIASSSIRSVMGNPALFHRSLVRSSKRLLLHLAAQLHQSVLFVSSDGGFQISLGLLVY